MAHTQLEQNVIDSFRLAKKDIIKMQTQMIELSEKQEELAQELMKLANKENKLNTSIDKIKQEKAKPVKTKTRTIRQIIYKKSEVKHRHPKFLASKTGKKFHIPQCPFAKNIQPKSKIIFKTKTVALNKGFKPCNCVKK